MDHLMDGWLFDLDNRHTRIGEGVVFAVERLGQIHQQPDPIIVILVGAHQGEDLR